MMEQDKKSKFDKISETVDQVSKLQKEIYVACDNLDEHAQVVGGEMHKAMLAHLYEQYLREFGLMNASKLINVDKQLKEIEITRIKELAKIENEKIKTQNELEELRAEQKRQFEFQKKKLEEEFKLECEKELGEIELERVKQSNEIEELKVEQKRQFEFQKKKLEEKFNLECEKKLGEIRLEQARIKADIELRRQKQDDEINLLFDTAVEEAKIRYDKLVPGIKRRFKLFGIIPIGKVRYNQAMDLALESAEIGVNEYLMSRAEEIADRKERYMEKYFYSEEEEASETPESEAEQEPVPMNRRERKKLLKRLKRLDGKQKADVEAQLTELIASAEVADLEPEFVPEPMTERGRQNFLKEMEREQRRQSKEEKKQLKKQKRKKKDKTESEEHAAETSPVQGIEEAIPESEDVSGTSE